MGAGGRSLLQNRPLPARGFLSSRGDGKEVAMKCNLGEVYVNTKVGEPFPEGASPVLI